MNLSGHTILIIETHVTPFTARLESTGEAGAQSILARTGDDRARRLRWRVERIWDAELFRYRTVLDTNCCRRDL